jgi:3-phenylpropionate/trans-cinnamate dioxygenase ferredoxin component
MYNYKEIDATNCEYVQVAEINEIPDGERIFLEIDEKPIVVFNISGGLYAIGDVCTHDNGPLGEGEVDGIEVVCPRHGARFDIRNGKATGLPAIIDIPAYPVRVTDGQVEIGIPLDE